MVAVVRVLGLGYSRPIVFGLLSGIHDVFLQLKRSFL